ncbi:Ail/Lom family outer membrane beta-barrel protein [Kosakonia sp. 1610]|uniref:Ail/Lom family outer membrane beta-barrel protein n=1 Tax=Kosakonia sp. 1610 TaxID=3156426 RepID=UPI003D1ABA01
MKKLALFIAAAVFAGNAAATAGDSTLTVNYFQTKSSGMKDVADTASSAMDAWNAAALAAYGKDAVNYSPEGYSNLGGVSVHYRYEITDTLGVISAISWARETAYSTETAPASSAESRVKGSYLAVMAGPSYRINNYVSVYAMAGVADKKLSVNTSGDIGDFHASENQTDLAYGAGAQFNIYKGITLDLAYEASNGGEWKTSGISAGLGYKF